MLVRERMTPNPIVVHLDTPFVEALQLLREKKIRRLPVLDKQGNLVGIVVEKDLLYASPSPATSLSVFEVHYLLSKLLVKDVMTHRIITVGEDCPLEEAARIMVDHRIGSLPIMRGKELVGIITETDIFRSMAEALGGRAKGVRVALQVPNQMGELKKLTGNIAELGGNITSLAIFLSKDSKISQITLKVQGVPRDAVVNAIEKMGAKIDDVRETTTPYEPQIFEKP